jgi:hypothetical protein
MSYRLSRLMSAATAGYAGYCFAEPGHLGKALDVDRSERSAYEQLARVFGVRDAAVSAFGLFGRSERTVRTAMRIRILCDVGDGIVLAARADDDQVRAKVLGATLGWASLNFLALRLDVRRSEKSSKLVSI